MRAVLLVQILSVLTVASVSNGLSVVGFAGTIGTIHIRADGSIDPSTAPISTTDNMTYTFTGDVYDALVVERNGVVIDGAGHSLIGPDYGAWSGISFVGVSSVTIQNMDVSGFSYGIYAYDSTNCTLIDNWIHSNADNGVFLGGTGGNRVIRNNLSSNGHNGIDLQSSSNAIVGNLATGNGWNGFTLYNSSDNVVSDNNASNNGGDGFVITGSNNMLFHNTAFEDAYGFRIQSCMNTTIHGNTVNSVSGIGIYMASSSGSVLSWNNVTDSGTGFHTELSPNSTLRDNRFDDNRFGLAVYGNTLWDFVKDIDTSNTVNGRPIYYLTNRTDEVVDNEAALEIGYLALVNCTRMTIRGLTLADNTQGILLAYTANTTIADNTIAHNWYGVELFESSNNTLSGNTISGNSYRGADLLSSPRNTFSGNNVTGNPYGLGLVGSPGCAFDRNTITANDRGIYLYASPGCLVIGNRITENGYGIYSECSSNGTLTENRVARNWCGMCFYGSVGNQVYHNDFLGNIHQAINTAFDYASVSWDNGYPSGGNFWSDDGGTDVMKGPSQSQDGHDGIGDTPYIVELGVAQDNYPLMSPFGPYTLPVASFGIDPANGSSSTVFKLNASSSSDPENPSYALEIRWDWEGDGIWDTSWSTERVAYHTYSDTGMYNVTLEVRNVDAMTNISVDKVVVAASSGSTPNSDNSPNDITAVLVAVIVILVLTLSVICAVHVAKRFRR